MRFQPRDEFVHLRGWQALNGSFNFSNGAHAQKSSIASEKPSILRDAAQASEPGAAEFLGERRVSEVFGDEIRGAISLQHCGHLSLMKAVESPIWNCCANTIIGWKPAPVMGFWRLGDAELSQSW